MRIVRKFNADYSGFCCLFFSVCHLLGHRNRRCSMLGFIPHADTFILRKNCSNLCVLGECWIRLGFSGLFLCLLTWKKSDLLSFPVCFSCAMSSSRKFCWKIFLHKIIQHTKKDSLLKFRQLPWMLSFTSYVDILVSTSLTIQTGYKRINQLKHDLVTEFHLEKCYVCKKRRFRAMRNKNIPR